MYVVPYEKDVHLFQTRELWDKHQGVTSFPVLRYASSVADTGCNHPDMLAKQPKFYVSSDLENRNKELKTTTKYDTDKYNHGYIPLYNKIFNNIVECTNVLEIGIHMGGSLMFLKDFFPKATIYGVDIHDKKEFEKDRIKTFIGNQENRNDLDDVIEKTNCEFDLIIDDGGHTMKQQQTSFGVLFKKLKSGGVYVIEDLHTSDRQPWMNDEDEISTLNMLRNFKNNNEITSNHMNEDEKKYIQNNTQSIEIWSRTEDFQESVTSIIIKK
jgi:cephalosporin hydroxylase